MKKKLLPVLLALCMVVTLLPATAMAAAFDDVDGHWGEAAIERWADYGVLNGKGDGVFDPDGTMTRAEFATMLANMMGYTKTSTETFTDLDPNQWYAEAISKLVAAGVMNGVGNGMVDPEGQITREQAAVMLCRAFGIKPTGTGSLSFNDSENVSDWAVDAMTALSERGMINGVGGNLLSPEGIVNRATAAQLASNMVAEYVTSDRVITGEVKGVVLVVNGAKADIRNATITAPIVVENASAALSNTKAENVKVEGSNASVTADASSSVTDVSLAGDAPKADIKGAVSGTVTVEENTTGATATVPSGTSVSNESGSAASVNGSSVASGGTTTAPSTSSGGSGGGGGGGSSSKPSTPTITTPEITQPEVSDPTKEDVPTTGNKVEQGTTEEGEKIDLCKDDAHTWGSWTVSKAASCKDFGERTRTCSVCQATATEATAKVAHTAGQAEVETAGDCVTKAVMVTKCTVCDTALSRSAGSNDTTKHKTVKTDAAVPATCTTAGKTEGSHCEACNTVINKQEAVKALGHDMKADESTAKPATCTEPGNEAGQKCQREGCEYVEAGKTIPAKGHDYTGDAVEAKDATCAEAGHSAGNKCVNGCNGDNTKEIPATGQHNYEETEEAKEATCGEAGKTAVETCSVCKGTRGGETIPATGRHSYEVSEAAKEATCGEAGKTAVETCSVCKDTRGGESIPATGRHSYEVSEAAKDATCGEAGKTAVEKCSVCNDTRGGETIPATGNHSFSEGTCTVCGASDPNASTDDA